MAQRRHEREQIAEWQTGLEALHARIARKVSATGAATCSSNPQDDPPDSGALGRIGDGRKPVDADPIRG